MLIQQLSAEFRPIMAVDATATTFTQVAPAAGLPADGVLLLPGTAEGGASPCGVIILPYGTGSNNNSFSMKVYGWRRTVGQNPPGTKPLWVPTLYGSFTSCTLSSALPGVAGTDLAATKLFCDAITQAIPSDVGISVQTVSPGGDEPASIRMSVLGDQYLEIQFAVAGGSATGMNALVAKA